MKILNTYIVHYRSFIQVMYQCEGGRYFVTDTNDYQDPIIVELDFETFKSLLKAYR